jgi:hypothetical protein
MLAAQHHALSPRLVRLDGSGSSKTGKGFLLFMPLCAFEIFLGQPPELGKHSELQDTPRLFAVNVGFLFHRNDEKQVLASFQALQMRRQFLTGSLQRLRLYLV